MKHSITPAKYRYRILAFPDLAETPFPIRVLSYYDLHHNRALHLSPDSESDSGRIVLNPIFGSCGPFWLRAYTHLPTVSPFAVEGWHFVPMNDQHREPEQAVEWARLRISLSGISEHFVRNASLGRCDLGEKSSTLRYAHYARITTAHTFPLDMLRYDRCALATQDDADTILKVEQQRRGGTIHVVQLSDSVRPHWWPDRWQSWSGVQFEILNSLDGLVLNGNGAYPLDAYVS